MTPLSAGVLEGALIGAAVGAVVGLVVGVGRWLFGKGKPCPDCGEPLPIPLFLPPRSCPKCGCKLTARGEKARDEDR
jgi:hypothetical protein